MISAVLPVHNTDPVEFREALDSLRRTQIASEIILVDDRTTKPGTVECLKAEAARGARVIQSRYPGTSAARATGVHAARGQYILNMDSDDTIHLDPFWRPDELAPVNIARQNSPWWPTTNIFDFIDDPGAIQWGAIVRSDLARYLAADTGNRQEDLAWGYRLGIACWRDRLPARYPSGTSYVWRSEVGRDTVTSRRGRDPAAYLKAQSDHLDHATQHAELDEDSRNLLLGWKSRSKPDIPKVESIYQPGAVIDTHVLHYSGRKEWLQQAIDSMIGQPTNIHVVSGGFDGSIGAARAYAFRIGDCPFVSFVDDDDYLTPGAFDRCLEELERRPDAVGAYTDTAHLHRDGRLDVEKKGRPWRPIRQLTFCPEITHAKVMRREAVMPHLDELAKWPTFEEYVLNGLVVRSGPWVHLPFVGAVKRFRPADQSSMRLSSRELWQRAVQKVTPTLLKAKSRYAPGPHPTPGVRSTGPVTRTRRVAQSA